MVFFFKGLGCIYKFTLILQKAWGHIICNCATLFRKNKLLTFTQFQNLEGSSVPSCGKLCKCAAGLKTVRKTILRVNKMLDIVSVC